MSAGHPCPTLPNTIKATKILLCCSCNIFVVAIIRGSVVRLSKRRSGHVKSLEKKIRNNFSCFCFISVSRISIFTFIFCRPFFLADSSPVPVSYCFFSHSSSSFSFLFSCTAGIAKAAMQCCKLRYSKEAQRINPPMQR